MTDFHTAKNDLRGSIRFWCMRDCLCNYNNSDGDIDFHLTFDEDKVSCGVLGNLLCPVTILSIFFIAVLTLPIWGPFYYVWQVFLKPFLTCGIVCR